MGTIFSDDGVRLFDSSNRFWQFLISKCLSSSCVRRSLVLASRLLGIGIGMFHDSGGNHHCTNIIKCSTSWFSALLRLEVRWLKFRFTTLGTVLPMQDCRCFWSIASHPVFGSASLTDSDGVSLSSTWSLYAPGNGACREGSKLPSVHRSCHSLQHLVMLNFLLRLNMLLLVSFQFLGMKVSDSTVHTQLTTHPINNTN